MTGPKSSGPKSPIALPMTGRTALKLFDKKTKIHVGCLFRLCEWVIQLIINCSQLVGASFFLEGENEK